MPSSTFNACSAALIIALEKSPCNVASDTIISIVHEMYELHKRLWPLEIYLSNLEEHAQDTDFKLIHVDGNDDFYVKPHATWKSAFDVLPTMTSNIDIEKWRCALHGVQMNRGFRYSDEYFPFHFTTTAALRILHGSYEHCQLVKFDEDFRCLVAKYLLRSGHRVFHGRSSDCVDDIKALASQTDAFLCDAGKSEHRHLWSEIRAGVGQPRREFNGCKTLKCVGKDGRLICGKEHNLKDYELREWVNYDGHSVVRCGLVLVSIVVYVQNEVCTGLKCVFGAVDIVKCPY